MERTDWENEVCNRKETYQEGIRRGHELSDKARLDKNYIESRRLWKEWLSRKITTDELQRHCKELTGETTDLDKLTDIFGGTLC